MQVPHKDDASIERIMYFSLAGFVFVPELKSLMLSEIMLGIACFVSFVSQANSGKKFHVFKLALVVMHKSNCT